ncbi:MAG: thiamine-phosphate kinase, partial [Pseudonocardiaceae bacterium]
LTVVRYPAEMSDESFSSVLYGIREACDYFNVPNVGGDIGGAERLILSGTALGVCKPGNALMRRGARPGDVLCITGPTGLAGAAMKYFRARKNQPEIESKYRKSLLAAWKRPEARVKQGICLGNSKLVTSCIDTSDGLKAAVESIAIASRVSFTIYEDHVPITPEVIAVCEHLGEEPMSVVMGDSVDFQLAFTVPEIHLEQLTHEFANKNLRFIPIGIAVEGTRGQLLQPGGDMIDLPGSTWRHDPD